MRSPAIALIAVVIAGCDSPGITGEGEGEGEGEAPSTWALVFEDSFDGYATAGPQSAVAAVVTNNSMTVATEAGAELDELAVVGSGCSVTSTSLDGAVAWHHVLAAPTRQFFASTAYVDATGRTWVACTFGSPATSELTLPPLSASSDEETKGAIARFGVSGEPELLETSDARAYAFASWPDGRTAVVRSRDIPFVTTVEWRAADGTIDASLVLEDLIPFKTSGLQLAAVDDLGDDVLLNCFGSSTPSTLPFADGQPSNILAGGSVLARVSRDGLVWAAATERFDGQGAPDLIWLSKVEGGFVLSGSLRSGELTDLRSGAVLLANDDASSFIASLGADQTIGDVVRFPSLSGIGWSASINGTTFGSAGETVATTFLIASSRGNVSPAVRATNGCQVFGAGLGAGGDALVAGFNVVNLQCGTATADITALVPNALVDVPASSFVLARIATP